MNSDNNSGTSTRTNLLSLPLLYLFIWHIGTSGQTWHVEYQQFGPWVQNSSFIMIAGIGAREKTEPGTNIFDAQKRMFKS
jgi:hypothetical protein